MEKDVRIEVDSMILRADEPEEHVRLQTDGAFFRRGENCYLLYEETQEDAVTKVRLKLETRRVVLKKTGAVHWEMTFEKGQTWPSVYQSPFGAIPMEITTEQLSFTELADSLEMELSYRISSAGEPLGTNRMRIRARQK